LRINALALHGIPVTQASYQTAPLGQYSATLTARAAALFHNVAQRLGTARAKQHKGSFSVLAGSRQTTAAKILIYETGRGKMNGTDPLLRDGIYVLIRTGASENSATRTLGIAPKHDERFAYFRLGDGQDLEEVANFIAACANADRAWTAS
jgi:hypothetical protein